MEHARVELNTEQHEALEAVKSGKNVFITGAAGVGKSLLIREVLAWAHGQECLGSNITACVTAMTGVAAANVNGATLHSWAGIGLGKKEARVHAFYVRRSNPDALDRYRKTDLLIIDEFSTADIEYIRKVNEVAQIIRNNKHPFGGIQLVLLGDFYQLGPVQKSRDKVKFIFEGEIWNQIVEQTVHLTQVYRQTEGDFVDMLHRLRVGDVDEAMVRRIQATSQHSLDNSIGVEPTVLFCRNVDVDRMNDAGLRRLGQNGANNNNNSPEQVTFVAKDSYASAKMKELYQKSFTLPENLKLMVGAQVMLMQNLDVEAKLVNGSRGVVEKILPQSANRKIPGSVFVRFMTGALQEIKETTQSFEDENSKKRVSLASRTQIPLKLAYALTIHKSQGLSIDVLEVDLYGCFAHGQAYVALSRATSFEGLRVKNFHPRVVKVADSVRKFYAKLLPPVAPNDKQDKSSKRPTSAVSVNNNNNNKKQKTEEEEEEEENAI